MDKKIYIFSGILVGVLLLIVILLTILGARKNQPATPSPAEQNTVITPVENTIGRGRESLGNGSSETEVEKKNEPFVQEGSPEYVAREFYKWYRGHTNPLGSGAYKTNPDVSAVYRESMDDFIIQGDYQENDPVLTCVNVIPPDSIVPLAAEMDGSMKKASVIIQEEKGLKRGLYEVILTKEGSKWLVEDVRCTL